MSWWLWLIVGLVFVALLYVGLAFLAARVMPDFEGAIEEGLRKGNRKHIF